VEFGPFDWLPKAHSSHRALVMARRRQDLQATYNCALVMARRRQDLQATYNWQERTNPNQLKVKAWEYNAMIYLRWARGDAR